MTSFRDRVTRNRRGRSQGTVPESVPAHQEPLRTGKLIGTGGEGAVYEDLDDPRMVIKVFHPQHATPERAAKLQAMCNLPPENAGALSWPNLVERNDGGLSYRMARAPDGATTSYRFISANERRQLPKSQQDYEYRTMLGINIARAFSWLHDKHVRIGDVNPSNILVSDDRSVMMIDCDSFQVPGLHGDPYPCIVGSPEYTAPEIDDFQRQFRNLNSDNFALAVLLYQLLSNGSHPYQGIDASPDQAVSNIRERIKGNRFAHQPVNGQWRPTSGQVRSWRFIPQPVQNAFRQAFSPNAVDIGRPTADSWVRVLEQNPRPVGQQSAEPVKPPQVDTRDRSKARRIVGLGIVLLIVLVGLIGASALLVLRSQEQESALSIAGLADSTPTSSASTGTDAKPTSLSSAGQDTSPTSSVSTGADARLASPASAEQVTSPEVAGTSSETDKQVLTNLFHGHQWRGMGRYRHVD